MKTAAEIVAMGDLERHMRNARAAVVPYIEPEFEIEHRPSPMRWLRAADGTLTLQQGVRVEVCKQMVGPVSHHIRWVDVPIVGAETRAECPNPGTDTTDNGLQGT